MHAKMHKDESGGKSRGRRNIDKCTQYADIMEAQLNFVDVLQLHAAIYYPLAPYFSYPFIFLSHIAILNRIWSL